ncbi:MAG: YqzL family protein [Acetivibrio sp.]
MKNVEHWNVFEQTGSIDAYLLYACASEKGPSEVDEEGEVNDESGKYYGNGTFRHTGGGI